MTSSFCQYELAESGDLTVYVADELPVSCPSCGHFVSYSVTKCGTCSADLSKVDLHALAQEQWRDHSRRKGNFGFLTLLVVLSWAAIYFSS